MPRTPADLSTEPCRHLAIADSNIGHISICPDCSVLHLSLAHVSLRCGAFSRSLRQIAIVA